MKRKLTNLILKRPEVLTFTFIFIYFLGMGLINPAFLALDTLVRILFNGAMLLLVTMGIAGVLVTKNIDASVGSLLGLAAGGLAEWIQSAADSGSQGPGTFDATLVSFSF